MLNTVNVVVIKKGMAFEVFSFEDSLPGNEKAEEQFLDSCSRHVSNWDDYTQEDRDSCIEDGYCEYGQGFVQIIHSN